MREGRRGTTQHSINGIASGRNPAVQNRRVRPHLRETIATMSMGSEPSWRTPCFVFLGLKGVVLPIAART